MERTNTKVYPSCCLSASCGKTTCPDNCPCLPRKQAFDQWVKDHAAVVKDPTWCRTVYTATK